MASDLFNSSHGMKVNNAIRISNGTNGNLTSVKNLSGDESLNHEQLLEKLRLLMELLKKQERDDISQESQNVNTKENRDDTETEGTRTKNHDRSQLDMKLMDAVRKIQKE